MATFPNATVLHAQVVAAQASQTFDQHPAYDAVTQPILRAAAMLLFTATVDLSMFDTAVVTKAIAFLQAARYTVQPDPTGKVLTVTF